jgi:F0F1-type ATP synthase membrane subunit b/b'
MSQGPINFGNIGDVDMYPEQTGALMRGLSDAAEPFEGARAKNNPIIAAGEEAARTDYSELAKTFRANYNASVDQINELSAMVAKIFEAAGANGTQIVSEYVAHSEREVQRMRRLE